MNQELQSQLLSIIPSLVEQIKATKDFALDQAPDIINQLLVWNFTYSILLFALSLFFIALGIILLIIGIRKSSENIREALKDYNNGEKWTRFNDNVNSQITSMQFDGYIVCGGIVSVVLFIFSAISFFVSVFAVNITWLKIWIAPKVWLIEYASNLLIK